MNQINVIELKTLLEEKKITLIDVREDFEIQICSIKGSLFIPMSQIPASIDTLNCETSYAVICHSGIRSLSVTNFFDMNPILSRNGKWEEHGGDSSEIQGDSRCNRKW